MIHEDDRNRTASHHDAVHTEICVWTARGGCAFVLSRRCIVTDTLRLRRLQEQLSHAERLLEAVVVRGKLVPDGAYRIRDPASAPKELRRIARIATGAGRAWSCWAQGFRHWLFIGEMSFSLSRERGAPVMLVDIYDEEGLQDSSSWVPVRDGTWQRCADGRAAIR